MLFIPISLPGAWLLSPEPVHDDRGSFTRTFDADAFKARDLSPEIAQASVSVNARAGTLRGLHFQQEPHAEQRIVRCQRGGVWDVIVDLRPGSPTRLRWHAAELNETNGDALVVPPGFAHGFQTLTDAAELLYLISVPYAPDHVGGVHWADPQLGIAWPPPPATGRTISERDRQLPHLTE